MNKETQKLIEDTVAKISHSLNEGLIGIVDYFEKQKTSEAVKDIPEEDSEDYTVEVGFHNHCPTLRLDECWVKDSKNGEWMHKENIEIIYRGGEESYEYPYKIIDIYNDDTEEFKCLRFKLSNFKKNIPVDWPVKIQDGIRTRFLYEINTSGSVEVYTQGYTSLTNVGTIDYSDYKFLYLEKVKG